MELGLLPEERDLRHVSGLNPGGQSVTGNKYTAANGGEGNAVCKCHLEDCRREGDAFTIMTCCEAEGTHKDHEGPFDPAIQRQKKLAKKLRSALQREKGRERREGEGGERK